MLARLSIRDIVLIERLDIEFSRGLAVLTGETGAGKSILLDAFALALGGRGDAGLVRHGVEQGQVTAAFDVPKGHPATKILAENGLEDAGEMILRRVQLADGRTRAFINDQAISVQTLKAVGSALVEIHGQHDERALVDASTHRRLLDAFAGLEKDVAALEALWEARRTAKSALDEHRAGMERAAREADYLRHAADELKTLAPKDGEETALAERRTTMMQGEKIAADLREAQEAVSGPHSPVPALSAAVRRLERRAASSPALVEPAVKAIDAAINALEEADQHLNAALIAADFDPAELERIEERLFALRAAARKYSTPVDGLAALAAKYAADVALIDAGADQLKKLEAAAGEADKRYGAAATKLSAARTKSAEKLNKAVNAELAPLKLERAKFTTQVETDAASPGPQGIDRIEFWVQTNPGTKPGPLMKVASGGELSRFLLALKVVLSDRGSAPDAGVRRNRYRRRRRGGGRDRRAAGAACRQGAGDGGDACAAGRGARQPASADFQGRARQGQARRHPRQRARRRPPPRGNRPHAGRRRDHRRGEGRRGTAAARGDGIVADAMAKTAKATALPDVAKLTKAQAKVEHMRLALELEAHDRRYYQDDAPSVTDAEYDALRQRFNAIEKRFPESRHLGLAVAEGRRRAVRAFQEGPSRGADAVARQRLCRAGRARFRRAHRAVSQAPATTRSISPPSRRSTACRCRCVTRAANSSPPRPAATARRARTSPPISARSKTCRRR